MRHLPVPEVSASSCVGRTCVGSWSIAALAATIVLATACEDSPAPVVAEPECGGDSDCESGRCEAGSCVLDSADGGELPEDTSRPDAQEDAGADTPEGGQIGDPCDDESDCSSGFCVEVAEGNGQRVCTGFCDPNADTCPEGWVCTAVVNNEADRVFLCFPERDFLCHECSSDSDCGGLSDRCLDFIDGRFCGRACSERPCPDGYDCLGDDDPQCQPQALVCTSCFDPDEDGFGSGTECLGEDCNEEDRSVNAGAEELCNERDDDCDGDTDEGFDLRTDPDHCGACDARCALPFAVSICVDGACAVGSCDEGWGDCNDDPEDGCETDLTAPDACGTCEALGGRPGDPCGTCGQGVWLCTEPGTVVCDGDPGDAALNACGGCGPLNRDLGADCGTCGLGEVACDGREATMCAGDPGPDALNGCGGCTELLHEPGLACGVCDSGIYACEGLELVCAGDGGDDARNACEGCETLPNPPGTACGRCGLDQHVCDGLDATNCNGDTAFNTCGGCMELPQRPGASCGVCGEGEWVCNGPEGVRCDDPPPPAEVCNVVDDNCNGQIDEGLSCTVNVHRSRKPNGTHFYTTSRQEAACCGFTVEAYDYFALYQAPAPGLAAFYRCFRDGLHFYTTSPTCELWGQGARESRMGYIATRELPGTRQLYRAYDGDSGDHFYTTSLAEFNQALRDGYSGEPSAGWVFSP